MRKDEATQPLVAYKDGKILGILTVTDFDIAENYRRRIEVNRIDSLKRTEEKRSSILITMLASSRYRFFS